MNFGFTRVSRAKMLEKIGLPAKPSIRGNNWVVDASHCQGCASQFTFINRKVLTSDQITHPRFFFFLALFIYFCKYPCAKLCVFFGSESEFDHNSNLFVLVTIACLLLFHKPNFSWL